MIKNVLTRALLLLVLAQATRCRLASRLLAHIIAVEVDPLADVAVLEELRFVMTDGIVYKRP